ncbi:unnamed protein product [Moneuplotes crassus]|uniref:Uncharacterized protein n=1 Tax=Euplotes crassus TaxID=5936 RepID=A0AAD1UBS4_EUPCR|nr:unnamed protein product [Moneuplotes crassus]
MTCMEKRSHYDGILLRIFRDKLALFSVLIVEQLNILSEAIFLFYVFLVYY